jgi:LuxR family transcriptional regulator, maltose regulon positive regulatory protein
LAALSLGGVEDRHAYVGRFGATSRHIVDFLTEEVLYANDPEMLELMVRCSILDRFCGSLCDAVLEHDGAAARLAALARTNLFLVPLDDRGEWYRFHHLFAELLRLELGERGPETVATLHRRAHAWHRDHGTIDEAIRHALVAGAFVEAADLVAAVWLRYVNVYRFASVLAWVQRFPDGVLREDARLLLVKAWVLSLAGRGEAAARVIEAVKRSDRLDQGPLPDGFTSVEASLTLLKAISPLGNVGTQAASARRAAELEGPESPWRSIVCWANGWGLYFSGDVDEADCWFEEAVALARAVGLSTTAAGSLAYRSLMAGDQGRLEEQRRLADEAAGILGTNRLDELNGSVHIALGVSRAADGRLEEALPLADRGLAIIRGRAEPLDVADALLRQLAMLQCLGESERAAAVLAEVRTLIAACPDPGVLPARLAALEPRERRPSSDSELSEREHTVLRLLSGSLSQRDIGRELYLSHNTVHSHVQSIYRKLGVVSRAEAIAHARRDGLLQHRSGAGSSTLTG